MVYQVSTHRGDMMSSRQDSDEREIDELQQRIDYHRHRYHELEDPIIPDNEYDNLLIRLSRLKGRRSLANGPD